MDIGDLSITAKDLLGFNRYSFPEAEFLRPHQLNAIFKALVVDRNFSHPKHTAGQIEVSGEKIDWKIRGTYGRAHLFLTLSR